MNPDHLFRRTPGMPSQGNIPILGIVPGRWQPRRTFNEEKLNELANSIKEVGVLTRIKVFWNGTAYELIAGERRWRASKKAGLESIPAEIVEWTKRQIQEVSIIDNLQRDDLTPEDEGNAFEMAIKQLEVSEVELAKRMGKGRTYIQQRRKLASAAPELRQALTDGTVTFSIVRGILTGAGSSHDFQRLGLDLVLEKMKNGHRIREKDARLLTSNRILGNSKEGLEKLGWNLCEEWLPDISSSLWTIYSRSDKPSRWRGQKVHEVLSNRTEPEEIFIADELAVFSLTNTESKTIRLRKVSLNRHACKPYVKVTFKGTQEWMGETELKMFLATLRFEIDQRVTDFKKHNLDLRVSNFDFNLYTAAGVPTTHMAMGWARTGTLLAQLESREIKIKGRYSEDLKEVGASTPQEHFDMCVLCNAKGKGYEDHFIDKTWEKLCPTCKKRKVDKRKAETKKVRDIIKEELTLLLEGITNKQWLFIQHLIWEATGTQLAQDEVIEKWSRLLWDDNGMIYLRKTILRKELGI